MSGNRGAAFMSGVLQAKYDKGELSDRIASEINEMLEEDGLEHLKIE